MNGICQFRKCTLSDEDLMKNVDQLTDKMFQDHHIPSRNIPALPDHDYDLLVGELILRFRDTSEKLETAIKEHPDLSYLKL